MYTAPNATSAATPKEGLMAWAKGAEQWLDDRGRKAWIIAMILGFIFVWPVGLGLLAYMIWSKRMFNRSCAHKSMSDRGGPWARSSHHFGGHFRSSGNTAFDAYKAETLRRLQDEQDAFEAFLQRLRDAKDKSEFDAFMDDRARVNTNAVVAKPEAPEVPKTGEY